MSRLNKISIVSPTRIILTLRADFGVQLSPGTVYPIFHTLEREGKIKKLPNKTNRIYILTYQGKKSLENFNKDSNKIAIRLTRVIQNI